MLRSLSRAAFVFGVTSAVVGIVLAFVLVYLFGSFDPKFRAVPFEAFKLEVMGTVALALIGAAVTLVGAVVRTVVLKLPWSASAGGPAVAGGIYPLLLYGLGDPLELGWDVDPIVLWMALIAYPLAVSMTSFALPFVSPRRSRGE